MATTSSMDVRQGVRKLLWAADPDLAGAMLRSAERVNSRNG
ncbi:MAG TPA: hypothetical protein VFD01_09300 [Candidatus Dormibacteraeota bacterium]|jgi:hypothetical protein|nr:hypothetical protein [Candidatus Dormibacteraeota bacterium]